MSHFAVLVIGEDIDEKLAPYQEGSDEYSEFQKELTEDEAKQDQQAVIKEYETKLAKNDVKTPKDFNEFEKNTPASDIYGTREYITKNLAEYKKLSVADFVNRYHGYSWNEDNEAFGHFSNPDSKWDWFQIGGRWAGGFKVKPSVDYSACRPLEFSWGWDEKDKLALVKDRRVDQATKAQIDWNAMLKDPKHREQLIGWWNEAVIEKKGFYKPEYFIERFGSLEEYIRREMLFTTHAVITESGEWKEVGSMGWWGMSSESHSDDKKWSEGYHSEFIEPLKPNTLLTVVDCHI